MSCSNQSKNIMKAIHRLLLAACACGTLIACAPQENKNGWKLAWEETFDQATFDTAVWSKIPRGQSDWCRHMSFHPDCYAMKDGHLVLRGIMNPAPEQDTARFITGAHHATAKRWAEECGFEYLPVQDDRELEEALARFTQPSITQHPLLMEVFTDSDTDVRLLREYYHSLKKR